MSMSSGKFSSSDRAQGFTSIGDPASSSSPLQTNAQTQRVQQGQDSSPAQPQGGKGLDSSGSPAILRSSDSVDGGDKDAVELVAPASRAAAAAAATRPAGIEAVKGPPESGLRRRREDGDDDDKAAGGKKRSKVWTDFDVCPMNSASAVCKLCPKGSKVGRIKRCGGNSSMSKHINGVHGAELVARGIPNNGCTILDNTIETELHFRRTSLKWMLMAYKVSTCFSLSFPRLSLVVSFTTIFEIFSWKF